MLRISDQNKTFPCLMLATNGMGYYSVHKGDRTHREVKLNVKRDWRDIFEADDAV